MRDALTRLLFEAHPDLYVDGAMGPVDVGGRPVLRRRIAKMMEGSG